MTREDIAYSLRATSPIFAGYLAIGIPFGLMTVAYGYPVWLALVMSVAIYAGSGQYLAIALYAVGANIWTILVSTLVVNSRHIVYGISLIERFCHAGLKGRGELYAIFALTDETYAIMSALPPCDLKRSGGTKLVLVAFFDHLYWIAGSVIGAVAGAVLPFDFKGVEFALTALFAVLLVEQVRATKDIKESIMGAVSTAAILVLGRRGIIPGQAMLPLAVAIGVVATIWKGSRKK